MPDKEPRSALLRTGDLSSRDSITARRRITMLHSVTSSDDRRLSGSERNQTEGGNEEERHLAGAPPGACMPTQLLLCFSPPCSSASRFAKKSTQFRGRSETK